MVLRLLLACCLAASPIVVGTLWSHLIPQQGKCATGGESRASAPVHDEQAEPRATTADAALRKRDFAGEEWLRLHALIKPRPGESPWQTIPWLTDLQEARQKAAQEGKPLFVWSAAADPIGCT